MLDRLIEAWAVVGGVVALVLYGAMAVATLAHMGPWWP